MSELQPLEKPVITHTQLVRYAGASGDFNPIHTVVPVAQQAGLGDCIAHGMLLMGFAGEALTKWFPRKDIRSFHVRFSAITRPGEKVTVYGKIIDEREQDGERRHLGEVVIKNEQGELKLKGRFEAAVQEREV